MGLPEKMQKKNVSYVFDTASTVAPKALDITKTFYGDLLTAHPEMFAYFNSAHNVPNSTHQPEALAGSVIAYSTNIKNLKPLLVQGGAVDAICHRHCALGIQPAHYPVVHDFLMESVAKVLGPHNIKNTFIGDAWSESVLYLAKVCIDKEESLYAASEKRAGGWRGLKDFKVTNIEEPAKGIKSFTFKPAKGNTDKFDFTPGQYLTVKVDPDKNGLTAPRHYTVTSEPGSDFLQCTVKKIKGGKVSTFLHDSVKVGDTVQLAPPYGVFTLESAASSAVLMSAGIGVTPMVNFSKALKDKVKLTVHVDKDAEAYAFRSHFDALSAEHIVKYTGKGGRTTASAMAEEAVKKVGPNHVFYLCGPPSWMEDLHSALMLKGAKKVKCEVFGSQLATKCPFSMAGNAGMAAMQSSRR